MYNMKRRYGDTALITGASSGIGKAFAVALARENMNLILVARREAALIELADGLEKEFGIQTQVLPLDLLQHDAADKVPEEAQWPIDLLINNAGYGSFGHFQELDLVTEENMVDLNCRQVVSLTHKLLPHMIQQKKGGVVCLASIVSHLPTPYMATYSATKAFNRYFALGLYGELKCHNVDVLALCPGDTKSEFREQAEFDKPMPIPQRTVENVVDTALKNLGKRASVIDGPINRLLAWLARYWPEKRVIHVNANMWKPSSAS